MSKLAITTISIALLAASGFAQADGHADHQAQIETLQQEKSALLKRLNNAIAFSKSRGAQLESEKRQRVALSKRLNNAIAFSKNRGAQLESEKRQRVALSKRLNNAIAFSKTRGEQLESEKKQRVALSKRLNNAIAFSKTRGGQLESEKKQRVAMSKRLNNAIAFSKTRGAQLESEKKQRVALSKRLNNAIAFSKTRRNQLESEQKQRKTLSKRLRNAIAFSKSRASGVTPAGGGAHSNWAANEGASLNSAFGGVQGTSVSTGSEKVTIQVGNNGLFRTGGTRLSNDGSKLLSIIANELSSKDSIITVIGHTDNVPVGSSSLFSSNESLSFARAVSTLQFLRDQGISNERLSAAGYGESSPIASNSTPEGRQQNRRVEIIVRKP